MHFPISISTCQSFPRCDAMLEPTGSGDLCQKWHSSLSFYVLFTLHTIIGYTHILRLRELPLPEVEILCRYAYRLTMHSHKILHLYFRFQKEVKATNFLKLGNKGARQSVSVHPYANLTCFKSVLDSFQSLNRYLLANNWQGLGKVTQIVEKVGSRQQPCQEQPYLGIRIVDAIAHVMLTSLQQFSQQRQQSLEIKDKCSLLHTQMAWKNLARFTKYQPTNWRTFLSQYEQ